jgi:hypothetical protein
MEAKDITKATIQEYLTFRGIREEMIFGEEHERVDPIDRHIFMRDMYENLIGYRMTDQGMRIPMPKHEKEPVYADMYDFEEIQSIEDAVINLKFLAYAKEPYQEVARRRLETLRKVNKENELER